MKASLKFREDQLPIARAKIPINIFNLPFLAGAAVAAGEPRELGLNLATAFESGPSFRVSYRPNDPASPMTLSIKIGIGAFGSPIAAPMSMTTEFNLLATHSGSPGFSVVFKPRLGDFFFKKSASSRSLNSFKQIISIADHDIDGIEMFPSSGEKPNGHLPAASSGIRRLLSGLAVTASSVLPLRNCTDMKFQWRVRLPPELQSSFSVDKISVPRLPMLVLSKICVQYIPATATSAVDGEVAAEASKSVRRELAALQAESGALRKVMEDLRQTFSGIGSSDGDGKMSPAVGNNSGRIAVAMEQSKRERRSGVKATPEDVNEKLKKAIICATGSGN